MRNETVFPASVFTCAKPVFVRLGKSESPSRSGPAAHLYRQLPLAGAAGTGPEVDARQQSQDTAPSRKTDRLHERTGLSGSSGGRGGDGETRPLRSRSA